MGLALSFRVLRPDRLRAERLEPGVAAPGPPPSPRPADPRARVLEAAVRCVARFGVSKTTVEDVAHEARLSRATLYRHFPGGRDEILDTMVAREVQAYFARLAACLEGIDDYEERIVVAMTAAAEELAGHAALARVLAHEPELVLPHVSFAGLDRLLEVASSFFAPYLAGLLESEDARRVGEWVTRLVLSHVACPASSLEDAWPAPREASWAQAAGAPFAFHPEPLSEDRARWLVAMFVMPGISGLTASSSPPPSKPTTQPPSALTV